MRHLKLIMMDFDGVILESNRIKDDAFRHVFEGYPSQLEEIMAYHRRITGVIRFDKFRHVAMHILKIPYDQNQEDQWAKAFSKFALAQMNVCPFVEGALDFLNYFYLKVPLYLLSATAPADLEWTLNARGLTHFFKKTYATDQKKIITAEILKKEKVHPDQAVFIGDAMTDYDAAKACEVPFIGRRGIDSFEGASFPVCGDLREVRSLLEQRVN
jgi:beta-phosphoglucomutase-like phosphatase (HAD superfamily)